MNMHEWKYQDVEVDTSSTRSKFAAPDGRPIPVRGAPVPEYGQIQIFGDSEALMNLAECFVCASGSENDGETELHVQLVDDKGGKFDLILHLVEIDEPNG